MYIHCDSGWIDRSCTCIYVTDSGWMDRSCTLQTLGGLITLGAHAQRGYDSWSVMSVCVCVCLSVTLHLTSRMFVRLTNDTTYLTGNEGQNF